MFTWQLLSFHNDKCTPIDELKTIIRFLTHPNSFNDRDGLKLSRGSSGGATPFTFNPCLSRTCGKKSTINNNSPYNSSRAQLSGKPWGQLTSSSRSIWINEKYGKLVTSGKKKLFSSATSVVATKSSNISIIYYNDTFYFLCVRWWLHYSMS